ncbi:uncharacterized protein LOC118277146 isoform X2 [Spodoptera frugiperda]|nr:uncharacterized protein LOC118277146 isoform X2 [Spodoptera frugiperda]XP_035451747.2 uncharacterized protein LOC118277146 isoform X2 [Spodoptera frugiperda]
MKSFIIIAVLSALAACHGAAVPPSEADMFSSFIQEQMYPNSTVEYNEEDQNITFSKGEVGEDQILLLTREIHVPAEPGKTQYANLIHRSPANIRITRVRWRYGKLEKPADMGIEGMETRVVHISYTSFEGDGIHVFLEVFGRIVEN